MARKSIAWILDFTSKLPSDEEKVKCLQANDNSAIRTILRFALDPNIKWLLPPGDAPYEPCKDAHQDSILYTEARKLYLFVEGGNPNLTNNRREQLYINLLQIVDKEDAKLLIAIKDKKIPYKGLTEKVIKKAFPDLY